MHAIIIVTTALDKVCFILFLLKVIICKYSLYLLLILKKTVLIYVFIKNFICFGLVWLFFCIFSLGFRGLCKMLVAYEGYIYFCMYPAFCILSKL